MKYKSGLYLFAIFFTFIVTLSWNDSVNAAKPGASCSATPITFTSVVNADFSMIDGTTGTGTIDMGTDAAIVYGVGYGGAGVGVSGVFIVQGTKNCKVSLACDTTAIITDGSGNSVTLTNLEIRNKTTGAFGTGSACAGTGTPVILGIGIKNNSSFDTYFIAGSVDGTGGIPADGPFSTANAGGNPISIVVTYDTP